EELRDRIVAPDRQAPLHALVRPAPADLQAALAERRGRRGGREPPRFERDQRELEALALAPEEVLPGNADLGEADDAVLDRSQPHEMAADDDLDARPGLFDDEGGDLLRVRMAGHDHEELGDRAVRAPEFFAVENVVAFGSARRRRREI